MTESLKKVYFDTETTDLKPGQICQLAFIVQNGDVVETAKNYFFTVDHVNPSAEKVHGMSKEWLYKASNGMEFKDLVNDFLHYFLHTRLIAHNAKFDINYITTELQRVGIEFTPANVVCTMEYFKPILCIPNKYPRYGKYKNPNLEELVDKLKIDKDKVKTLAEDMFGESVGFHDARFDTTAMFISTQIYKELKQGGYILQSKYCTLG